MGNNERKQKSVDREQETQTNKNWEQKQALLRQFDYHFVSVSSTANNSQRQQMENIKNLFSRELATPHSYLEHHS